MNFRRILSAGIAALLLALSGAASQPASAQTASGRNVRIVVPFPPGGTADVLARILGQQIGATGGPNVLVENRPGGGTVIATDFVARSAPDGNTLLLMANSFVINASVRASLPYDPLAFEPICLMVNTPQILVVNASSPLKTLGDFVSAAKAKPGELNYAAVGPATTQHIAAEMFKRTAGITVTYVPFAGGAPAITALVGGHVMIALANPSEVMSQIRGGQLRALAVASRERFSQLPDTPTIIESGYPDFEASAWFGLVAPPKTPKATIASHITMFRTALAAPEPQSKLGSQGYNTLGICGDDFAAHIRRQHADYARVVKDAGIKVD